VLWIETVGFLSQNYITPHNNLVNMIVLLEYFPTSISVCMWNKFHAIFYLKDVMNRLLFKILKEVWFMICMEAWLVLLSLNFSDKNLCLFKPKDVGSWGRGCTNHRVEDEGAKVNQRWFGWTKSSANPLWSHMYILQAC
jgi:hypothetical protein